MAGDHKATDLESKFSEPWNEEPEEPYSDNGTSDSDDSEATRSSSPGIDDGALSGDDLDPLRKAASFIKSGKAKDVVFLLGAGISTSAGIPDFRSPSTGLYHNLQALELPFPEAVFELGFFQRRPEPFWTLAKEIYPGRHFPTPTHYLLQLFNRHNLLKRVFTQNIDTLETLAGLPPHLIVEAHGSFATAHCLKCRREVDREEVLKAGVRRGEVVRCDATLKTMGKGKKCGGLVKPDIVFFGEGLPDRFFKLAPELRKCDLLIIIGTSLQVQPFASLVDYVPSTCPRLLINREAVGPFSGLDSTFSSLSPSISKLLNGSSYPSRDMFCEGDADLGAWKLAEELGWKDELEEMVKKGREELEREWRKQEGGLAGEGTKEAEKTAEKVAKAVTKKIQEEEELEEAVRKSLKL
ncbi:NAD-dependent histone deacetylase SIR2 [Cryptococcus neoformans C23]|uniref:NAD-dependent protein deacetylase n=1 Tax=Cryptococcus neoformans (strain H99 / ATCC 208821 / CBS 10515 / FGSC 9487) TaxID=235443 RepID=J9VSG8_CRYN9|nr:NAD-dependent histone deacetylase SIR2 [Cryptococcus neoformans var. grubii H99]AUB26264.1 NAD-dependent histone deacetylase SIR2 [Cryptococcus neoformans var. grubii]OWZ30242.1 NAD-dependent histone deacetylase SIR2 [Cryptococcus neoformans var. grubii AD2-60a]OWZ41961.1 NAD-dependent histone deacetylase SIR2 [Cryptococcus neoformans var. grubii C23]OXC83491.1 NAD-dependent histone deacetylase SIR2 [Cryptococcus neoformans var. grubii AD1-7a]AFR96356.2 NAD-dependent histone deacetylase SIR|eukprot:XP_012050842.1 NAD-dependent histone deacetylase SIR2 [Cryptococcus neoformans var. grubii H99]